MTVKVNDKEVREMLGRFRLTRKNMLDIAMPTALTIVNSQRTLVPKDTHDTENSVQPAVIAATKDLVTVQIGPSTEYSEYIEFGTTNPNYPIQPFVRPSVVGVYGKRAFNVAQNNFKEQMMIKLKRSISRRG
jgi:hypothetical protein